MSDVENDLQEAGDASTQLTSLVKTAATPPMKSTDAPESEVPTWFNTLNQMFRVVADYHEHQVLGLENLPSSGPCLVAVNHSLATYDIMLLSRAIFEHTGRRPMGLGDRLIFKTPILRDVASKLGIVEGDPDTASQMLRDGNVVVVAPGGMMEALRPSTEKYQIRWEKRLGFVKLAIMTQTPIILAACPKADDLYEVFDNRLTRTAYEQWRVPVPVCLGRGATLLPRREKMLHVLSEPIVPGPIAGDNNSRELANQVRHMHAHVLKRMQELMRVALDTSR